MQCLLSNQIVWQFSPYRFLNCVPQVFKEREGVIKQFYKSSAFGVFIQTHI